MAEDKHNCGLDVEELKKSYGAFVKKYSLPEFDDLAQEFDVEKTEEKSGKFILRKIRRIIVEKISAYLHLFETFMNPSSAPMLIILMLKTATEGDKKEIEDVYRKLAKIEIGSIKLDTIYSEKNEAEMIVSIYSEWQKLKTRIFDLIVKFDDNFDINSKETRKGYFG